MLKIKKSRDIKLESKNHKLLHSNVTIINEKKKIKIPIIYIFRRTN